MFVIFIFIAVVVVFSLMWLFFVCSIMVWWLKCWNHSREVTGSTFCHVIFNRRLCWEVAYDNGQRTEMLRSCRSGITQAIHHRLSSIPTCMPWDETLWEEIHTLYALLKDCGAPFLVDMWESSWVLAFSADVVNGVWFILLSVWSLVMWGRASGHYCCCVPEKSLYM